MSFAGKMQGIIDKGVVVSRDLASKARGKAKDLGAMGVLKLEIMQLKSEEAKLSAKLGDEVYTALVEKNHVTVSRETPSIHNMLKRIEGLRLRNALKVKEYHSINGKKERTLPEKTSP
jgi:hypothetical protein